MAYLDYGVHQGEGFIVITGEIGAGKTMLARTLARKLETSQNVVVAQVVSTQLKADDIVRMVAAALICPIRPPKLSLLKNRAIS
jgi:type II secretory pathway predicted ATPase ExeA